MLIRLRLLLAALMMMMVISALVASSVLRTVSNGEQSGLFAKMSLQLAVLPIIIADAFVEAGEYLSGSAEYVHFIVPLPDHVEREAVRVMTSDGRRIKGLTIQGDPAQAMPGWRLVGGQIDHGDGTPVHTVVLIGPDMVAHKVWRLNEERVQSPIELLPPGRKHLHGLELLSDGSITFAFTHSIGLQRWDVCDGMVWSKAGAFHHTISYDADKDSLWSLHVNLAPELGTNAPARNEFLELDPATGAVKSRFSVADIMAANPDLAIFDIARIDADLKGTNSNEVDGQWLIDPYHFNDVDPLPASLSEAFPEFKAGDLLISARTLNSVMVVDPDDYRVKWHRTGETLRQHDPDWQPDGTISVYNNKMGRGPSEIVSFDPSGDDRQVVLAGEEMDFYSRIQGRHQQLPNGGFAVASPQQGRAFETDAQGRVVMEFFNLNADTETEGFVLSEYHWFPVGSINLKELNKCASH